MSPNLVSTSGWLLAGALGALTVLGAHAAPPPPAQAAQAAAPGPSTAPAFLRPGQCYRLTFPISGSPHWTVLETLEGGWIRAEVDSGPASARREPVWVNTSQIVTVREARCSE